MLLSIRRYLFGVRKEISRFHAYCLLSLLGAINVAGVVFSLNDGWLPLGPIYQKIVAVGFFSYLGFALVLALYFGLMRLVECVAVMFRRTEDGRCCVRGFYRLASDEHGYFKSATTFQKKSEATNRGWSHNAIKTEFPSQPKASRVQLVSLPSCSGEVTSSIIGRRDALKIAAAGGLIAGSAMLGAGILEAYQKPVTQEWEFQHPMLSGLKDSLTVVHATDFHFGMFFDVEDLERLVETLNYIEGDALVLTGDIYHSPLTPVEKSIPILKRLSTRRIGNFAVLGNHEFYAGLSRSLSALEQANIKVLRNEWHTYTEGGVCVHLGGIDDPVNNWLRGSTFPKFSYLMKIAPQTPGMKILLCHRPTILPEASKAGIDLVLSGHTHGGQIILPSLFMRRGVSVARLVSPFTHGWYRVGNTDLYLNRGVGMTFIPWRVNCPPEIAVFRLRNENSAA